MFKQKMYREQILKDEKRKIQKSENNKKKKKYCWADMSDIKKIVINIVIKYVPFVYLLSPFVFRLGTGT